MDILKIRFTFGVLLTLPFLPTTKGFPMWHYYPQTALMGHDIECLPNTPTEQCILLCEEAMNDGCYGVDSQLVDHDCCLNTVSPWAVANGNTQATGVYDHYSFCSMQSPNSSFSWEAIPGQAFSGLDDKVVYGITLEECKISCVDDLIVGCRSIDYRSSDGTCCLSHVAWQSSTFQLSAWVATSEWDHYFFCPEVYYGTGYVSDAVSDGSHYVKGDVHAGVVIPSLTTAGRSSLDCARQCMNEVNCTDFVFDGTEATCTFVLY